MTTTKCFEFPFRLMFSILLGLSQVPGVQVLRAQPCENCVYYDVTHLSRIEGHPDLGEWDELWTQCVPFDFGRDFRVTADGTVASKFEVSLVVFGPCTYNNEDPMVEFMDENFEPVTDPTPEEHGIITVVGMTSTTVFFEYTHPTDLPPAGEKFRQVRIAIKDYSYVTGDFGTRCWLVINIYRPPVLLVHGLWSNSESFEVMAGSMSTDEYEEQMIVSANYEETNASSFSTNADVVPTGINLVINQCRDSYMSAGKVNLVGHSMGGILSRQYLQTAYRNDVHRLITCNTPHSGSQAANFLLDPYWSPINGTICDAMGFKDYRCYDGAIDNLRVGGAAITSLNNGSHPGGVGVHALTTTKVPPTLSLLESYILTWSELQAILLYLATTCGAQVIDTLYQGEPHDLVVAEPSQTGGLSGNQLTTVIDQMHVGSTANPGVIYAVKDLLNEPLSSSKFTLSGYNPASVGYNTNFACDPLLTEKEVLQTRFSSDMTFGYPQPGDSTWTAGDTLQVTVFGPEADTLVLVFKVGAEMLYCEKQPGPEAEFSIVIPEDLDESTPILAFGYSSTLELLGFVGDTVHIQPQYSLTGISVFPTKIFSNTGDTTDFQVIGHYDDGIDRPLNGNPELTFTFTTWSASPTAEDDILLNFALNDTLVVSIDTFSSPMVKIFFEPNPAAPIFWLGGTGDWNDDTMWDIGCAPGQANTAYILSGECTIPPLIHAYAKAVEVTDASVIIDGQLSIAGSASTALNINKSTFVNNGTLTITDISNTALWLQGTSSDSAFLINNGDITVSSCEGTYGVYIGSRTRYWAGSDATLTITDCGLSESLQIQSGVSGFSLDNTGSITVDGGEVGGVGRIRNSGMFSVVHSVPDLYTGLHCSYLHNTSGGIIQLGNIFNAALNMSYTTDSLVNEGELIIDGTNYHGMWVANCVNSGNIQIRDVADHAIYLEGNNYLFQNLSGGTLDIANADKGIYVRNTGARFENNGNIIIDTTLTEGIEVRLNAVFENDSTGIITIRNAGTQGVYVLDNTTTIFNNSGILDISGTSQHGIRVHGNGAFHNLGTGRILVRATGSSGLTTTGLSFHGNTIISNAGHIDIALPIGTWGIDHTKRFTNHPCGILITEAPLRSAAANFVNEGFMHLHNTAAHTVTSTGTKIVNNGWIADSAGLVNPATQVTNNAVLMQPVAYSGCSGTDVTDFFGIGSFSGFSVSEGYTDLSFEIQAGSLDTMSNTFTPLPAGVLSTQWYFHVMDADAGCVDTLSLEARPVCPVTCANDPYYWTGCTSTDWSDPDNWNLGVQPSSIDTITIPGLPAGLYFPEILNQVSVGQLHLDPGSYFTIKTGGELLVED